MTEFKELEALETHLSEATEEAKNATTAGTITGVASLTGAILASAASPLLGAVVGLVGSGIASAYLNKKIRVERSVMDETKKLGQELEQIWRDTKAGKYGTDESIIKPEIIPSEDDRVILSVPVSSGTKRRVFERNSSGDWQEVPFVGQTQPFA